MKRPVCVKAFLAAVVASGWFISSALAETSVQLVSVRETRYKNLAPQKKSEGMFSFNSSKMSMLVLTVELRGDAVIKATKDVFVSINSAVDDTGKELKDAPKGLSREWFVKIDREMLHFGMDESKVPKDNIKVDLRLDVPSRSATSITRVDGSLKLKLQTGEPVKVVLDGVRKKTGQTIQDPRLAKCGVQVKIISFKAGKEMFGILLKDPSKAIGVQVSGKVDAVELSLVAPVLEAYRISRGDSLFFPSSRKTYFLESMDPLPEDAKLAITLSAGQEDVEVPFNFENVPLP